MYNLVFTTYEGVTSIVLCHESKEFLEELIEEVKEYNIESMALIKREIGPFKADYINSQEISNIEQNINNLKGAINAYMSLINNGIDVDSNTEKYTPLINEKKKLQHKLAELNKSQDEHITKVLKDRAVIKTKFSKLYRDEVVTIASRYTFMWLSIVHVKHFDEIC